MKTTVHLSEDLLTEARRLSSHQGIALGSLIEEGLRLAIQHRTRSGTFRLRNASVKGMGLQPGVMEGSWNRVPGGIYEGRGS